MQSFNFGIRKSSAESVDDTRSRYVPSSVYSGAGPVDDSPAIGVGQTHSFMSGALRGPFEEHPTPQQPRFPPVSSASAVSGPLLTSNSKTTLSREIQPF